MSEEEYEEKYLQYIETKKYTDCLTFSGYNDLLESGYSRYPQYIDPGRSKYTHYQYEDVLEVAKKIKMCPSNLIWPWERNHYFKQQLIEDISKRVEKENRFEAEKRKQKQEEREKQATAKHLKELETKYKVNMCRDKKSPAYYLFNNKPFPTDCAFEILNGSFIMIQQLPEGTLVRPSNTFNNVLLILKNPKDSKITDGIYDKGFIPWGLFQGAGIYDYVNLRGVRTKALKLKRVY